MSSSDRNPSPEHDATGSSARQHGGQDASVHIRRHPSGTGITRTFLQEITYPHNIHPVLVPGISVEDQRMRYGIDTLVTGVSAVLIVGFIVWGLVDTASLTTVSTAALTWTMTNMGWAFNMLAVGLLVYLLYLAISRYGRIPLGMDDDEPEYSTASWTAMLFAAGIGIGIIFFGPFEPMTYFLSPRPGSADPGTHEAMKLASAQAALHWGLNAWAIYALVGLGVAYTSYRRGRVPLMSSVFAPFFRDGRTDTIAGRIIDALAILATLFGTAAALGIGALQIGRGVEIVAGLGETGNRMALLIIAVLTAGFIASAVSGVSRGIRILSNINMVLAIGLALFFFVLGPTAFLLNFIPSVAVTYVVLAFTILGGTAIREQMTNHTVAPDGTIASLPAPEEIFFVVLDTLPGAGVMAAVVVVMLAIFFITTADSASVVTSQMSQRGNPSPRWYITVFWGLCMAGIAVVMLLIGGQSALTGLQNMVTVTALPFTLIMFAMVFAIHKDLRRDPMILRHQYARWALDNSVRHGVDEHGDDFMLSVERASGEHRKWATAADFDSTAPEYTDWYQRTDEDGNPLQYDYESSTYTGEMTQVDPLREPDRD